MDTSELIKKYEGYLKAAEKYFQLQEEYENVNKHYMELCKKEKDIREKLPVLYYVFMFGFAIIGAGFLSIIGGIVGLVVGAFVGAIYVKITKADVKFALKADEYHASVVVPAESECEKLRENIDCHFDSAVMKQLLTDVPEDFRSVSALEFCLKMLKNRQADTEKECYNLYVEYLQRQQIIALQDQQVALGQQMLEEQKSQTKVTTELNNNMEEMAKRQKKISKQVRYGNVVNTINLVRKK